MSQKIRKSVNRKGVGINVMDSVEGKLPKTREERLTARFDLIVNAIIVLSMLGGVIGFLATQDNPSEVWGIYAVCWGGLISAVIIEKKYGK